MLPAVSSNKESISSSLSRGAIKEEPLLTASLLSILKFLERDVDSCSDAMGRRVTGVPVLWEVVCSTAKSDEIFIKLTTRYRNRQRTGRICYCSQLLIILAI